MSDGAPAPTNPPRNLMLGIALAQDESPEYVVIGSAEYGVLSAEGFYRQGGEWLSLNMSVGAGPDAFIGGGPDAPGTGLEQSLQSGSIEAISPEFRHLRIGDIEFNVYPRR